MLGVTAIKIGSSILPRVTFFKVSLPRKMTAKMSIIKLTIKTVIDRLMPQTASTRIEIPVDPPAATLIGA